MKDKNYEDYDKELYPLTDIFEKVTESNFFQFTQIAIVMYHYLLYNKESSGYHFVNWRVNFGNLYDFVTENNKTETVVKDFLEFYEESAPLLYQKLGLKY